VEDEDRVDPPLVADEKATLVGFLEFHRDTFLWKIDGLTPEQLRTAATPPSDLTLWGLLRHLAEVDRGWFHDFDGADLPPLYCTPEHPDGDLVVPADADLEADLATFGSIVERSREIVAGHSLDDQQVTPKRTYSLRWIVVHLIEEYARHNGHADLLREALDGTTGE
jgi:hypothetical protein